MQSFSSVHHIGLDLRVLAATVLLHGLMCQDGRTAVVSRTSVEDPYFGLPPLPPLHRLRIGFSLHFLAVVALALVPLPPPSFSSVLRATLAELPKFLDPV